MSIPQQEYPVAIADLPLHPVPGGKIPPTQIRELRELIQRRYKLDRAIYAQRHVGEWDKELVEQQMAQADAILIKIQRILSIWEDPTVVWDPMDREKVRDIRARINAHGKRFWTQNPVWGIEHEELINNQDWQYAG
jgi:hypothetical protein